MGKGIDLAAIDAPEHAAAIENMKEQLLIAFLRRLGGSVAMPMAEIDDTGQLLLALRLDVDARVFHFELQKKS
jgi:hypothetical protein